MKWPVQPKTSPKLSNLTQTGEYYRLRGDFKFSRKYLPLNKEPLTRIIEDYRTCISKSPTESAAWLGMISANIVLEDFDEAISLFGQCSYYTDTNIDRLGRSFLGCIALTMADDVVEFEDSEDLNDIQVELPAIMPYISGIISYINYIRNGNEIRWNKVIQLAKLYIQHFSSWRLKGIMLDSIMLYNEAIEACEKALIQNPGDLYIQSLKKTIMIKLNRHDTAIPKQKHDEADLAVEELEAKLKTKAQAYQVQNKKDKIIALAVGVVLLLAFIISCANSNNYNYTPYSSPNYDDYNYSLPSFTSYSVPIITPHVMPTSILRPSYSFPLPTFSQAPVPTFSFDFSEYSDD